MRSKKLHGQFLRKTDEIHCSQREQLVMTKDRIYLKREAEGLLVAAQSQALRTNSIKAQD